MKAHTKTYLDAMGYDVSDFIPCECCGARAVDIHHIDARGMGGDPQGLKDVIENLMAVCRFCHMKYGDKEQFKEMLAKMHEKAMKERGLEIKSNDEPTE